MFAKNNYKQCRVDINGKNYEKMFLKKYIHSLIQLMNLEDR